MMLTLFQFCGLLLLGGSILALFVNPILAFLAALLGAIFYLGSESALYLKLIAERLEPREPGSGPPASPKRESF